MTIDILICSLNKGIVRVEDVLQAPQEGIHYIVSYQYTDERYLELIPAHLRERSDVEIHTINGKGLSANRNAALSKATADIIVFADDDARFTPDSFATVRRVFEEHPHLDVAFFKASTYTGKSLKTYPEAARPITALPSDYTISAIEMAARRTSVQGRISYDERFGLGAPFLTCGEEEVWITDALRMGLSMHYFPIKVVETSTMLKRSLVYVDAGVQRSKGAFCYYTMGWRAWLHCLKFAISGTRQGYCHFLPMMRHLAEGIRYLRK
ncbi:MAG: glycosyltransferase [Bacteroidales bacterium]|nr:glycosyltransferase [Candidatus Equimonas faecalis]